MFFYTETLALRLLWSTNKNPEFKRAVNPVKNNHTPNQYSIMIIETQAFKVKGVTVKPY